MCVPLTVKVMFERARGFSKPAVLLLLRETSMLIKKHVMNDGQLVHLVASHSAQATNTPPNRRVTCHDSNVEAVE